MHATIAELERIANARRSAVANARGRPIVAHLGADVPRVVIEAAGALPVRLFASRAAPADAGSSAAAAALGPGVDPALAPLVDEIASGQLGVPVVIDHSTTDHLRAWQTIGWLRGSAETTHDVTLIDLLHLDRLATHKYNRRQLTAFVARVGEWTGTAATASRLRDSIALEVRRRGLLGRASALRHGETPRITGSQVLSVVRAGWVLGADEHVRLLADLVGSADELPPVEVSRRGFFVGRAPVAGYEALEWRGLHVVGEDHDEGARAAVTASAHLTDLTDPVDALVALHHGAPQCPVRLEPHRRIAQIERSLVTLDVDVLVVDPVDATTRWLLPHLHRAAQRAGCTVELLDREENAA